MSTTKSWENIFVGREEEVKVLREALQKSAPSLFGDHKSLPEPQIVILKGEPGVGKYFFTIRRIGNNSEGSDGTN